MNTEIEFLCELYNDKNIVSIIDFAITNRYSIYYHNSLTDDLQALTNVQLFGLLKFRGINILLETGQTFQIGLELTMQGTFQEIYFADLIVDLSTLEKIKEKFKFDKNI